MESSYGNVSRKKAVAKKCASQWNFVVKFLQEWYQLV